MTDSTNIEIYSIGLLIFLFSLFIHKIKAFFQDRKPVLKKGFISKHKTLKSVKALSWYDFELLTMELYASMGWDVRGNEKKGADGGVDVWMSKKAFNNKIITAIVQCKRYENSPVTIKVIREMYGLKYEYEVDEVYIVTTSRFTKECQPFAKGKNMTLVDGKALIKLMKKYSIS